MTSEHKITSFDGLSLYAWSQTADNAKGSVCLVHGMGEHSHRYDHVAYFFNQHGYSFFSMDHRGHGRSEGKRGHMPSFDALLNDVDQLLELAKSHGPQPLFLYGHSMGGNVVLNYVLRRKPAIAGVISTSPYLRLAFAPPAWKVSLGKLVAGIIPGFSQATGLEAEHISHDPGIVEAYQKDPLVHDKITARFFTEITAAGEYAIAHASELTVPALVVHGTADQITSAHASELFVQQSQGKAVLKLWEGLYHETHNEPEKSEVLQYTLAWMEKTAQPQDL